MVIRLARERDLPPLKEIYNEEVRSGTATFDTEERDDADRRAWFSRHTGKYLLLVAEDEGVIAGYASLSPYNERGAFYPTAEISVYVGKVYRGRGVGTRLMDAILTRAKEQKAFSVILSQITAGNEVSARLHRAFGFVFVGRLRDVGEKFGKKLSLDIYEWTAEEQT